MMQFQELHLKKQEIQPQSYGYPTEFTLKSQI